MKENIQNEMCVYCIYVENLVDLFRQKAVWSSILLSIWKVGKEMTSIVVSIPACHVGDRGLIP